MSATTRKSNFLNACCTTFEFAQMSAGLAAITIIALTGYGVSFRIAFHKDGVCVEGQVLESLDQRTLSAPIFFSDCSGGSLSYNFRSSNPIETGIVNTFPPLISRFPVIAINILIARMAQDAFVCWSREFRGLIQAGFVVAYIRAISRTVSAGTQVISSTFSGG